MVVRRGFGRRTAHAGLTAVLLLLAMASGVSAGRSRQVDPSMMTPPLNPSFDWECWQTANGIICDGERTLSYAAVEAFPCPDGSWVYATGTDRRTLRRIGDAEGRALAAFETVRIDDRLSRSAAFDGIVGSARGIWTDAYEYGVPGDLSSRVVTRRGVDVILTIPGQGMVVLDAGIKSWDIDDNILFARGPHALVEDIEGAFAAACAALGGVTN